MLINNFYYDYDDNDDVNNISCSPYLWYTDTHFDRVTPLDFIKFIYNIQKENPKGIFLTGDISNGIFLCFHLDILARFIKCPIYFVLGNHDYYFKDIESQHEKIRDLCKNHGNLFWLTDCDVVTLSDEVALVGVEGWYDAKLGNPNYLKATLDWMLIKNFRELSNMEERINAFQKLATESALLLKSKIERAIYLDYKYIYILLHFPPWKEVTRDVGTLLASYFLPYNVNLTIGKMIEELMVYQNNIYVEIFCGHTHYPKHVLVNKNIKCQVGAPTLKPYTIYV